MIAGQRLNSFAQENVLVIAAGVGNADGATYCSGSRHNRVDRRCGQYMLTFDSLPITTGSVKRGAAGCVAGTGRVLSTT